MTQQSGNQWKTIQELSCDIPTALGTTYRVRPNHHHPHPQSVYPCHFVDVNESCQTNITDGIGVWNYAPISRGIRLSCSTLSWQCRTRHDHVQSLHDILVQCTLYAGMNILCAVARIHHDQLMKNLQLGVQAKHNIPFIPCIPESTA